MNVNYFSNIILRTTPGTYYKLFLPQTVLVLLVQVRCALISHYSKLHLPISHWSYWNICAHCTHITSYPMLYEPNTCIISSVTVHYTMSPRPLAFTPYTYLALFHATTSCSISFRLLAFTTYTYLTLFYATTAVVFPLGWWHLHHTLSRIIATTGYSI